MQKLTIFWHRRDLRFNDNAGLYRALRSGNPVLPIFIFDKNILDKLEDKTDRRVEFIHHHITELSKAYASYGSSLRVFYSTPEKVFEQLSQELPITKVYTNHDYEPYALQRDEAIDSLLAEKGISFHTYKDQVIFEKAEVVKDNGEPYTVFTPYSRKWRAKLNDYYLKPYPTDKYNHNLYQTAPYPIPTLQDMGFNAAGLPFPLLELNKDIIENYHKQRDFPAIKGTTRLSVHLRFGTVSIRELAAYGLTHNATWLNELIWREFYMMILWHFPHVVNNAFKPQYDNIAWRNNEEEFKRWCKGETGYPIVDAGMRELNETGFMHNRVRMIVASFLTKHLLIDWRWGEAYFAQKLLDFELSSNNGGWQWAASSGCDAAPYFRVFNPMLQTEKFDPKHTYINHWVPQYQELTYPRPIVDHAFARERVLKTYKEGLANTEPAKLLA